jgi:hypothetical protein
MQTSSTSESRAGMAISLVDQEECRSERTDGEVLHEPERERGRAVHMFFVFEGRSLRKMQTADELKMQDGDVIETRCSSCFKSQLFVSLELTLISAFASCIVSRSGCFVANTTYASVLQYQYLVCVFHTCK